MSTFWILIGLTLVVAVADWWAVLSDRRPLEYLLKPLTMVVLIAAALALPDPVTDGARPRWRGSWGSCRLSGSSA